MECAFVVAARTDETGEMRASVCEGGQAREDGVGLRRARVGIAEREVNRRGCAAGIGFHTHPLGAGVVGEFEPRGINRRNGDCAERFPLAVPLRVEFEGEAGGSFAAVDQVRGAALPAREQKGIGSFSSRHRITQPDRAAGERGAEPVGSLGVGEPEIGLRLAGAFDAALDLAFVEELGLGRVIATEDEAALAFPARARLPAAEVTDDFEIRGARADAGGVRGTEGLRETPEHPVHGHEQVAFADLADARPLGVPAVRAVVAVTGLGQAEGAPLTTVEQHKNE